LVNLKEIYSQIFALNVNSAKYAQDFNTLAISVFKYQYINNEIYNKYVSSLNNKFKDINEITHFSQIPFLPIEFFKTHQIVSQPITDVTVNYTSSGTTGNNTSHHFVNDINVYESSFNKAFELFYGNPSDYCILALLPNYLERTGSSLVYMCSKLIETSKHELSGFYLNNISDLIKTIELLKTKKQKTILLGVTYALLDLAEQNIELNDDFIVMETGGMKGKRKEMLKEELHDVLKHKFGVTSIHSEYGMTELLSQAYSSNSGVFKCAPWMKVLIRDINDPFEYMSKNKSGGINVIDLANINSCSFIETKDLGRIIKGSDFEIVGRFDNSDLRGCNLMLG
jgi:phenylacetate-coenzyme A ligase PaaK-like adenylate-forming protein